MWPLYNINSTGPKTDPCGTPEVTEDHLEDFPFNISRCYLFVKKYLIHLWMLQSIPTHLIFLISLLWGTESKAFCISRYIISTGFPFSNEVTNLSKTVNNCKTQPLISLNPYCWLIIMSFVLICWSITSLTIVSNSLHNIGVTLIGLYFLGNDLSPLFCMGVTFDFLIYQVEILQIMICWTG